ncbi:MAG: glycerophosphodiester phosphodiesterase [Patescibacteria group bacterium]|jgi:glycerophosphoryl diester phosphodiesterase|nr:glycerophosphodiester phosphodiesterase [Patescibacteria group bacterium]
MLKIGHRGAKAYAPENTISSFRKALELGVDMVEMDIRITKDKHPVVVHDNSLRRLTKKYVRVDHLTLTQLKKFKIDKIEPIPTLAEVLEVIDSQVGILIDIKVKGLAQIIVQILRDYKVDFSNVMISSVHHTELRIVETLEPAITTALIFRSSNASNFWLMMDFLAIVFWPITKYYISWIVRYANADYLNINHRLLTERNIKLFKRRGIKICAWTVDSRRKINLLKKMGVDGIITNYPDRL